MVTISKGNRLVARLRVKQPLHLEMEHPVRIRYPKIQIEAGTSELRYMKTLQSSQRSSFHERLVADHFCPPIVSVRSSVY